MPIVLPIVFRTMNLEKSMGVEQRHVIEWTTSPA
jgi:hypothetical protein